jgi:hypothetical protein
VGTIAVGTVVGTTAEGIAVAGVTGVTAGAQAESIITKEIATAIKLFRTALKCICLHSSYEIVSKPDKIEITSVLSSFHSGVKISAS